MLKSTLYELPTGGTVFRDVLIGGRAEEAGIQPGDRLVRINDRKVSNESPEASAHRPLTVTVESASGQQKTLSYPPPATWKPRKEKNVAFKKLGPGVGYIRIASWPGILGMDVARETDAAIRELKAKKLIIDLRGNLGSVGAGNLRIMSYLTPEKIPVGYSLTRRRAESGYDKNELARFERIPRFKAKAPFVLWKFRKVDKSIVVVTEGLGKQAFNGDVTMLVNKHTVSGAEIVVHFAKQHGWATIVGERTAGRTLSYGTLTLPLEYRLVLPIGDYVPWDGERFEGIGVEPDVAIGFDPYRGASEDLGLEMALAGKAAGQPERRS